MKAQPLELFFDELVKTLLQDFLFYIPGEIIPENVVVQLTRRNSEEIFDTFLGVDTNNGLYEYEFESFNERLFEKHSSLEGNIFQIGEKHAEISPGQFEQLLYKYYEQVEFYVFVSNWLIQNVDAFKTGEEFLEISASLRFQSDYLNKHLEELLEHFFDGKELFVKLEFSKQELMEYYIPDVVSRFARQNKVLNENVRSGSDIQKSEALEHSTAQKTGVPTKKTKRKLIITEEQADRFILETVFHIKTP